MEKEEKDEHFKLLTMSVVNAYYITKCPRKVSIQVKFVRFQSQPGNNPNGYNPMYYQQH